MRARGEGGHTPQYLPELGDRVERHVVEHPPARAGGGKEQGATGVVRQTAQMLADFKEALLIPRELSGDSKRQRDRFIAAVGEMRRYVVTNLRVRDGVLKDAQAITRAQRHYQGGAGVLNEIAGSSPILERVF